MKPWIINILIFVALYLIYALLPLDIANLFLALVTIISAIWVYYDSKKLDIRKYKKIVLSPSTTPFGTAGIVWILWPITFPMYISWRYRAINGKILLKEVK